MGYIDPSICNGSGSYFMWNAAEAAQKKVLNSLHLRKGPLKLKPEQA